jgi:hypothetical protein
MPSDIIKLTPKMATNDRKRRNALLRSIMFRRFLVAGFNSVLRCLSILIMFSFPGSLMVPMLALQSVSEDHCRLD